MDATGLSTQQLLLNYGETVSTFNSATLQTIYLAAAPINSYSIQTSVGSYIGYFTLNPNGTFSYDSSLDGTVLSGLGTTKLKIVPHAVNIQATGLSRQQLLLNYGETPATMDSATVQAVRLAAAPAGSYNIQTLVGTRIAAFTVSPNGTLSYDQSLNGGVLSGLGTSTLTVVAHPITVDATNLPRQTLLFSYGQSSMAMDSGAIQSVNLAAAPPNSYSLKQSSGALIGYFSVTSFGRLDFDWSVDSYFFGRYTTSLRAMKTPGSNPNTFDPPPEWLVPYNGGDLMGMPGSVTLYLVFYGAWSSTQSSYFTNLAQHLGNTSLYNIVTEYDDHTSTFIHAGANYGGAFYDAYSGGKTLDDSAPHNDVQAALGYALNNSDQYGNPPLPRDSNGVYLLLLSPDVVIANNLEGNFCGTNPSDPNCFCAYHGVSLIGAQKYAPVAGMAQQNEPGCNWGGTGPTGTFIDGMASDFIHEMMETITDPSDSGYAASFPEYGMQPEIEAGDVCNFNPGLNVLKTASGGGFDLKVGNQYYLVQGMRTVAPTIGAGLGYCSTGAPYSATGNIIGLQSAVYGENCTSTHFADLTTKMMNCNGKSSCSYTVNQADVTGAGYAGSSGCSGELIVQWDCWSGTHITTVPAEAVGKTVTIQCP